MKYTSEVLTEKKFQGNVIVKIAGNYFCMYKPDTGLNILPEFIGTVASLVLNPTTFDIRKVSTSIASYSFRLIDKGSILTSLIDGDAGVFISQKVEIWIGRVHPKDDAGNFIGTPMDFSDYFKMPVTKVKACDKTDSFYNFRSSEESDRMNRDIFQIKTRLGVDITSATTIITCADDISTFPTSGFVKIENEFISYTGTDTVNKLLTGCVRGEFSSVPAPHSQFTKVNFVQNVTDNPLNVVLKLLTSNGGGGSYATLADGLGIDQTLIDVTDIEKLRDELFSGQQYNFKIYEITNALKYIEEQILAPCNLRFTQSSNSKLTLAVLDRAKFVTTPDIIDESTIVGQPKWSVDSDKIVNVLEIEWDYDEALGKFTQFSTVKDADSIAQYGQRASQKYSFKGIKSTLGGSALVSKFAARFLQRLSSPTPEIEVTTQLDRSLKNLGDKTVLQSSQVPARGGTLNFANELEIVSRAINHQTGDVKLKLQFTSFTLTRSCYIAPAAKPISVTSQKVVTLAAGAGDLYEVGWVIRLWDELTGSYLPDSLNQIQSISGDTITFANAWTTTLVAGNFRLKFPDYDDATDSQKRYCFVSRGGLDFGDGKRSYQILV